MDGEICNIWIVGINKLLLLIENYKWLHWNNNFITRKLSNTNKNTDKQNSPVNHYDFHQQNITLLFFLRLTNKNSSLLNIRIITIKNKKIKKNNLLL
jgi:hypothetical protein